MRFWQELLDFFVKFFQVVAYGLGSVMELLRSFVKGKLYTNLDQRLVSSG